MSLPPVIPTDREESDGSKNPLSISPTVDRCESVSTDFDVCSLVSLEREEVQSGAEQQIDLIEVEETDRVRDGMNSVATHIEVR